MESKRVIVAMSGGVDSSVAALLLHKQGFDVIGVTMRLYSLDESDVPANYRGCCTLDDVEDARIVCNRLNIPHYVFNVQDEFKQFVIDYFCKEYQKGRTPHPCIACNDKIKFQFLAQRSRFLGAKYIATGHYARIEHRPDGFHLLKAIEHDKDQSYVLFGMNQSKLSQTLLPVGWYEKTAIRELASAANFPNASKPDSQDICFIPSNDYRTFLKNRSNPIPGDILDTNGTVIGQHEGIEFYTIGQRRKLGITNSNPLYVVAINDKHHQIVVGEEKHLYKNTIDASKVNYIHEEPSGKIDVTVKVRYKSPEVPATLHPRGTTAVLDLKTPLRAITPGQAIVFYTQDEVIGGGTIDGSSNKPEVIHDMYKNNPMTTNPAVPFA